MDRYVRLARTKFLGCPKLENTKADILILTAILRQTLQELRQGLWDFSEGRFGVWLTVATTRGSVDSCDICVSS